MRSGWEVTQHITAPRQCALLSDSCLQTAGWSEQHPVPLELTSQAANIPVSMSQLLQHNSPNLNKLQSVERETVKE